MTDTIYALSTPVGGAIAVIRISGADTLCALRAVFSGKTEHRYVAHGSIIAADGSPIDDAMAVYFQGPKSYTGEDMAELYIPGFPSCPSAPQAPGSSPGGHLSTASWIWPGRRR